MSKVIGQALVAISCLALLHGMELPQSKQFILANLPM